LLVKVSKHWLRTNPREFMTLRYGMEFYFCTNMFFCLWWCHGYFCSEAFLLLATFWMHYGCYFWRLPSQHCGCYLFLFSYINNTCLVNCSSGWNCTPILFLFLSLILLFYNSVDSWKMIFAPCVMLACSLVGFEIISWFAGSMRVLLNHSMPLQRSTRCPFTLHLFLKCLACLNEKHY
jgi:hypothetical protein